MGEIDRAALGAVLPGLGRQSPRQQAESAKRMPTVKAPLDDLVRTPGDGHGYRASDAAADR